MQDKKQVIFQELGEFVLKQKIECYVLNGLDINSSKCGRDLDLYCESYEHRRLILNEFKIILERRRAKWIIDMNPLWGQRCIGIWSDYLYIELHFLDSVSSSFLDVYKVFTVGALQGPFGFMFSPWLIFSKTILFKHKDKILNRKPIWTSDTQIPFMCDNSTNIINNLAKYHTFPKDFFDALLGNNIPKNLYIRRQGFQTFRYKFLKREPVIAIGSMLKSLRKKIFKYSSPCAPVITINSNVNSTDIKTILEKNLLSVFHEIILKNESVSFLRVRSIMARQRLVVLINIRPGSLWILLNKNYYFEYNLEQIESLSEIMDNILDNMKVINES